MAALLKKRALAEYSQVIQEQPKPLKKLRLAKKITPGSSAAAYVGLLEKSKTSNDALQILLRISDSQKFQEKDLPDTIKKLAEHFQREQESVVRAKVLSLLGDIGKESGADVQVIIEEVMQAMKNEESHKVISQGISSLLKLGKLLPDNVTTHHRLVSFVKQYLSDTSHSVKCKCLELMGELVSISSDAGTIQPLLRLVGDYTHCEEARVRSAAFNTMLRLHERGLKLDPSVYSEVCLALKDDYEIVRQVALRIVWVLGQTYSENLVTLPDSDEEIRLVDDAFGKICHMINDLSMRVRTQAARLLGSMTSISPRFLQQTLDKKLMSNMRRKRSAHERAWESITSGEWSSGRNWADDAPRELVDAESVSLVNSGSCGAFVHGLEDEYQEVRNASVESLCSLAMNNPQFALMSLDFLVDMFNDEIEEVRLKAIDSLTKISRHIILREDQLETILGALKDFSIDVREGLHKMLASCRLSSKGCLQMCVEALLENLKKYPVDRKSTWCCLQKVGQQHPELTLILVPELLAIHPFFDMPEPDVEDPAYVSILILVLNAAQHCPTMLQLFEEHTLKHYCYLRDTMPHLVPALKVGGSSGVREVVADEEANATAVRFLEAMVSRLEAARRGPARVRAELLAAAQRDLARLAEVGGAAGDAARMSALHVNCQVMLARVLESRLWASPGALASQQGAAVRTNITQLLHDCLRLQYLFIGVSEDDLALVKQLKLKALALQLVYIVRCSNSSALALCDHFLEQVEDVHRYLGERGIAPEAFTASLVKEMSQLEETKPGPVARCLLPLLQNAPPVPQLRPTTSVQMTTATLACEPGGDADAPLKFTAGLVLGVPLEAELRYLQSPELLRIKVRYPDQQTHLLVPPRGDLRPGTTAGTSRLLTRALVSHQVWSEACALHIGLALDLAAVEGGTAAATAARRARAPADADPCLLDLCKPVKVYVSPKPVKRGI
ncbi:integrator complex subunit 4 [Schistocerca nitens]|uniref:integrator complex subunit 4 n=1 Tax=Schistocerca nitens TaxID=7011 RepID=UPI0021184F08|nr:integrator complex subunit 4 [Schistocerca nitens]